MERDDLAPLRDYIENGPHPEPAARTRARALARRLVPAALRMPARVAATEAQRPRARRRAAALIDRSPLLLHLGCGSLYKEGWVNIDLAGTRVDVAWNLVRGIPFPADSVDGIFHEHLLEHLSLREGLDFTRECLRVLRPGGVLRAGVPDAQTGLAWYAGAAAPQWDGLRPLRMLTVHSLAYEFGHRCMYDGELLGRLFRVAGFAEAQQSPFGAGELGPRSDTPHRRPWTLYVEGRKA